jgi:hypothetical protein
MPAAPNTLCCSVPNRPGEGQPHDCAPTETVATNRRASSEVLGQRTTVLSNLALALFFSRPFIQLDETRMIVTGWRADGSESKAELKWTEVNGVVAHKRDGYPAPRETGPAIWLLSAAP